MLDHQVLSEDRQNPDSHDYRTTISTLMVERAAVEAQRQVHLDRVERETRQIEAYDVVLASLRQKAASNAIAKADFAEDLPVSEPVITEESETGGVRRKTACGGATVADIMDCKTQPECLYVIARMNGGLLDVNGAADLIIAAGKSRGMRSTVISTAHHFMSESPDWQKVAPSKFRLIFGEETPVNGETAVEAA